MFEFPCLKYLKDILTHPRYIHSSAKVKLAELIEDVLKLEGKKSTEEVNNILRSKITNELEKDLRDVLHEQYSLPSLAEVGLAKLINEVTLPRKSGEKVENVFTKRMMNQKAQGCNS